MTTTREQSEWQFGKDYPGGFRVHRSFDPTDTDAPYSIAWDGQWLEGTFGTIEAALESGRRQIS